jgi:uncharacterized membrane protein YeaQ/YmgE (transglycosylase-associated protein family)
MLARMDLTFVGWIIVGLLAGSVSGVIAGGRTLKGWMPSLAIGLIAALITGWALKTFAGVDSITSIWLSALLSTIAAIVIRLLINTVSFSDD